MDHIQHTDKFYPVCKYGMKYDNNKSFLLKKGTLNFEGSQKMSKLLTWLFENICW